MIYKLNRNSKQRNINKIVIIIRIKWKQKLISVRIEKIN